MGSGPTILRLARGTSALDLDTEAGRAFLQERLAFYNKLCFLLSGGFFLVGALLMAAGVRPPEEVSADDDRRAASAARGHARRAALGLAHLLARKAPRPPALRAIDAGSLVLTSLGFALQSVTASSPTSSRWAPSRGSR